jgi:hypothetical protein
MILKMNFNFNFKDMLPAAGASIRSVTNGCERHHTGKYRIKWSSECGQPGVIVGLSCLVSETYLCSRRLHNLILPKPIVSQSWPEVLDVFRLSDQLKFGGITQNTKDIIPAFNFQLDVTFRVEWNRDQVS